MVHRSEIFLAILVEGYMSNISSETTGPIATTFHT